MVVLAGLADDEEAGGVAADVLDVGGVGLQLVQLGREAARDRAGTGLGGGHLGGAAVARHGNEVHPGVMAFQPGAALGEALRVAVDSGEAGDAAQSTAGGAGSAGTSRRADPSGVWVSASWVAEMPPSMEFDRHHAVARPSRRQRTPRAGCPPAGSPRCRRSGRGRPGASRCGAGRGRRRRPCSPGRWRPT